jgi:hypothetical protein
MTRATQAAANGRDGLQQRLEERPVVVIGRRDFDRQRDALAVNYQMTLSACFAPVGRVGTG